MSRVRLNRMHTHVQQLQQQTNTDCTQGGRVYLGLLCHITAALLKREKKRGGVLRTIAFTRH
eukprot:3079-Heterococcus_DN1.PRE.1